MNEKIKDLMDKSNRTGSIRNTLMQENDELRQMLEEMTPEERRQGILIGKLLESNGRDSVDQVFKWFESETGDPMTPETKVLSLIQAIQLFGDDQFTYNSIRKCFFLAKNQGTNIKMGETKTLKPAEQKLFVDILHSEDNVGIEQAFNDYGYLEYRKKMIVFFRAIELLGIVNEQSYIEVRNFFVRKNQEV